ncbi:mercury transporter [Candidatus Kaiserbacteria bacterium CG_4_8_14_3_um_filter_38_9]|uniref:Mercury transporter n=1 Tax=Candidatus Kaiserbacteria bacterium CG_4_8_14_3_um_filter_38_9 TaxID=1974599 RepID=A0A2M7INE1_9BACT|nr:MAG: mercury transporter [Candidatus Kaiserbacteria bacterium CG_4_8_14_3_um_filter_38_9]
MNTTSSKKGLYASVVGTILVALCCFTPVLVITVGVVGLGALTPYLDYILLPTLAVMIFLTISAYRKYKKECTTCVADTAKNNSHTK